MRGSIKAHGAVDVIWCPNPLRLAGERHVRSVLLTGTDTVDSLVRRLALQGTPLQANLNGADLARRRWRRKRVRRDDVLVLRQLARGVEAGAVAAGAAWGKGASITAALAIGTVTTFVVNAAIALAISALLSSLTKKSGASKTNEFTPSSYGVEGGANSLRAYEPLPLILGEHRFFPDYASRPFSEFVPDPTTATEIVNTTPATTNLSPLPFEFIPPEEPEHAGEDPGPPTASPPWTLIRLGEASNQYYFGDNQVRNYTMPVQVGNPESGPVTRPHTFVIRYTENPPAPFPMPPTIEVTTYEIYSSGMAGPFDWRPMSPLPSIPVIWRYGYTLIYNTERLVSIFNFGFGDLSISDLRIGATPVSHYNAVERHDSAVPAGQGDRTQLLGYTSEGWPGNSYPDNVQLVDGGKVENHPLIENFGWVERASSTPSRYTQIDITGRLFLQSDRGMAGAFCSFDAEYRNASSGAWSPMPYSPFVIANGSTVPVRRTMRAMLGVFADAVRVRRNLPDATDASLISEFEFTRVKFFRDPEALYPAQRRMGVMIKATGQLNGRIDRLSAFVQAKHWRWDSGAPWNGAMPGAGSGAWVWGTTVNPAWLFLYYARGGFLNPTAAPGHLGLAGWLDQPAIGNGPRLFGAGLPNERIDYAAIVAWGQFCAAAGLECRMAITGARPAGDVLDDIAAAGRATKTWAPGKLSVVWEAAGQPVVAAFGMSNIVAGSFEVQYSTDNTVDEYVVNYTRSDADYEGDAVSAKVPGVAIPVNQSSGQAAYSMSRGQAQRLVNLLAAARHYQRRIIKWETNILGMTVQRGDVVHLAHDLTAWAHSGRLVEMVAAGGFITSVTLSAEVDNATDADTLYLWIRKPGGAFFSVACVPPAAATRTLQVVPGAWPLINAPAFLTVAVQNPLSDHWVNASQPIDYTFFAGPTPTPGKRARIIAMEPSGARRVRITARDEYEAYYPLEYGVGSPAEPASGEQLVARAYNLGAAPAPEGGTLLTWELEAAHGATVMVSVNGGAAAQVPVQGYLTVSGTELLLPAYAPGTQISVQVLPATAGTPVKVIGDAITLTM